MFIPRVHAIRQVQQHDAFAFHLLRSIPGVGGLHPNSDSKKIMARLERKHPKRKAFAVLSHKLGRAVWHMLAPG